MAVNNLIKRIQNIMRADAGISGDAQRIEQMVWMFFLKVYDSQEDEWEYKAYQNKCEYKSIIPEELLSSFKIHAINSSNHELLFHHIDSCINNIVSCLHINSYIISVPHN